MTSYQINNVTDWETVASTPLVSGNHIYLNVDLEFSDPPLKIGVNAGVCFHGNDFTITFTYDEIGGLFVLSGGSIQNLTLEGGGHTVVDHCALFLDNTLEQWGTLEDCHSEHAKMGSYSGGIAPYRFGNYNNLSLLSRCSSSVCVGMFGGGIVGRSSRNFKIRNSYFNGRFGKFVGYRAGGICGDGTGGGINKLVEIQNCWTDVPINTNMSGGICGGVGWNCNICIKRCFTLGAISGYQCAGIIGVIENTGTTNIVDCYVAGNISNKSGGFVGGTSSYSTTSVVNITNCYQSGTISTGVNAAGSVVSFLEGSGSVNTYNCVVASDVYRGTGRQPTHNNISIDTDGILGRVPPVWSSTVWMSIEGSYPVLAAFRTIIWQGYVDFDSLISFYDSESNMPDIFIVCAAGQNGRKVYAVRSSSKNYYRVRTKRRSYFLSTDADTVVTHMNTEFADLVWAKEFAMDRSLDLTPNTITAPQTSSSTIPTNFKIYKVLNNTKYYATGTEEQLTINKNIAEVFTLTGTQRREKVDEGWFTEPC